LNVNANLVIFLGQAEKEYIETILTYNSHCNYVLVVKELEDLPLVKKYNNPLFWSEQEKLDKHIWTGRGQDCFKLWNSKFYFLKEAIELNPFNSDKFIWNDIGNIREKEQIIPYLKNYPNYDSISSDKIDIVLLKEFNDPNQFFFNGEVHFSGSMFGGGTAILLELCELFYLYFDIYVKKNMFIGCDQQILATVFLKNTTKFNCIIPMHSSSSDIDVWFYLYKYYM